MLRVVILLISGVLVQSPSLAWERVMIGSSKGRCEGAFRSARSALSLFRSEMTEVTYLEWLKTKLMAYPIWAQANIFAEVFQTIIHNPRESLLGEEQNRVTFDRIAHDFYSYLSKYNSGNSTDANSLMPAKDLLDLSQQARLTLLSVNYTHPDARDFDTVLRFVLTWFNSAELAHDIKAMEKDRVQSKYLIEKIKIYFHQVAPFFAAHSQARSDLVVGLADIKDQIDRGILANLDSLLTPSQPLGPLIAMGSVMHYPRMVIYPRVFQEVLTLFSVSEAELKQAQQQLSQSAP